MVQVSTITFTELVDNTVMISMDLVSFGHWYVHPIMCCLMYLVFHKGPRMSIAKNSSGPADGNSPEPLYDYGCIVH